MVDMAYNQSKANETLQEINERQRWGRNKTVRKKQNEEEWY